MEYIAMAGVVLLLMGSNGLGYCFCQQKIRRRRQLGELTQLLILLQGEIRCHKTVLEEAFLILQDKTSGFCHAFLQEMVAGLQQQDGCRFVEIWNRAILSVQEQVAFSQEERKLWMELGSRIGYLDLQMQEQVLEQYITFFTDRVHWLEGQEAQTCRIYRVFGAAGGLLLAVLLL